MPQSRPKVKWQVTVTAYQAISNLLGRVIAGLTGNVSFVTPNPSTAQLTIDKDALDAAIAAWGTVGNRGSHNDLLALRAAALVAFNDLVAEANYVESTVYVAGGSYADMEAILNSSGFSSKNIPSPQGALAQVQDLHRLIAASIPTNDVALAWKKPINVTSPNNVKAYKIFRGATSDFSLASVIGTVTKTKFTDFDVASSAYFYWVVGINSAGQGAEGAPLNINI